MKIFMSHHASVKPLVREVRDFLPRHVNAWIDEHELLVGETLTTSIREAIRTDADFLILFLEERAAQSSWVRTELRWALDEEERTSRPFVLPILVGEDVPDEFPWVKDRLYLRCHGYTESDVRHLAAELSSALFAWLSRDLDALRAEPTNAAGRLAAVDRADALLEETAATIRKIVFPYRRDHPLPLGELLSQLQEQTNAGISSLGELHKLLFRLRERRMISGIALTERSIFVGEEHLNWRFQEAVEEKRAAAAWIVDQIADGQTLYLDGGSSALEVCRGIARGVRFERWERLRIVTNSIPVAAEISDLANELGMEDEDPHLRVIVIGGAMRLNTSALVDAPEEPALDWSEATFDAAVIGTNGVSVEFGCTTTKPAEAIGKRRALLLAQTRYIMAEPSKYGVWQSEQFASFDDALVLVTACATPDQRVSEVASALRNTSSRIQIVEL